MDDDRRMDKTGKPVPPDVAPAELDEHVRTRLLHAAVRVFDRKGYVGASVREVAELAGVTKPALYYHFGSKEGVLRAILDQAKQEFSRVAERALGRSGSARERIVAFCQEVYGLFGQNVPVARVALAVFLGPRDVMPTYDFTVFEVEFRSALERIVEAGQAAGELREAPPTDVALAVMGILEECNERQLHPEFQPAGPDVLARLLELLFDGVAVREVREGEQRS
jgi:AcrR family transcriptional regulator